MIKDKLDVESEIARGYQQRWREKRFQEDFALQCLYESCFNAYGRGKENYPNKAYKNVKCEWESGKDMFYELSNDDVFITEWRKITAVYIASDFNSGLRPVISRKGDQGDYKRGNIEILSREDNLRNATSKECVLIVIKNTRVEHINKYVSIRNALLQLKEIIGFDCGHNVRRMMDTGVIHTAGQDNQGNDWSFIFQSKEGKTPIPTGIPKYLNVISIERYWVDLDLVEKMSKEEELSYLRTQVPIQTTQYEVPHEYIWINMKKGNSTKIANCS
ncbi:hypothetical protein [Paenibacillus macquariensis]|uniref:HNH nuclease domain-containing protein n=1 Tax=Paenibacillus macquariensis TaxID=948756 RepID=A0ABY1JKU0_9BACL|nr:hypothetical protein [Paenibacillus macquariensis]MEC0089928.1 hypothetical protein [Paenibacillus macquariensis]OAB31181.1 hypothetical protein PMSM_20905 [Paenibacillus macquariensis subsp. macquariensis]SIQ34471.1 hypothetical protein SAMN05421578_101314 [Paenibacillus macquariensis]